MDEATMWEAVKHAGSHPHNAWKFAAIHHRSGETVVLLTCSCGAKRTERFDGLWTVKQLGYTEVAAVREP